VNFLIDSSLSPNLAETLREAGQDAVHVRRYGIHKADDEVVIARAIQEDRVLVSADTDFATVLAPRQVGKLSVILLKRPSPRRPAAQANLLLANRETFADLIDQGSVVVIGEERVRSRPLSFLRDGKR
jgi:predicted nuclease of predicted toxin-antitoxin system